MTIARMFIVVLVGIVVQGCSAVLFSCTGRAAGYYADVASECQQYHVCTGGRLQYTYTCPNTTRFQQRMMICDHEYLVDCARSEQDFSANLLLGQRGVPFVGADEFKSKQNSGKIKIFTPVAKDQRPFRTGVKPSTPTTPNSSQAKPQQLPLFTTNRNAASLQPVFNFRPTASIKPATNTYQNQQKYASPSPQPSRNVQRSAADGTSQRPSENLSSKFQVQSPATYVKPFSVTWSTTQPKTAPTLIYHTPTTVRVTPPPPGGTSSPTENYPSQSSHSSTTPVPKQPANSQFSNPAPRGFSLPNLQLFVTPVTPKPETSFQTFVTTVSPIQDISVSSTLDPDSTLTLQRLRSLKGVDDSPSFVDDNTLRRSGVSTDLKTSPTETRRIGGPTVKLEWTLPDTRAMLFIPDDPADAVVPNIKRFSVTIPHPKMVFKSSEGPISLGPCPSHCDPTFIKPGTCHPCVMIK